MDLTVELQQDGTTIKTWTASGTENVRAGSTYYVASGHKYCVLTTANVYDANGKLLESPSVKSGTKTY